MGPTVVGTAVGTGWNIKMTSYGHALLLFMNSRFSVHSLKNWKRIKIFGEWLGAPRKFQPIKISRNPTRKFLFWATYIYYAQYNLQQFYDLFVC